MRESGWIEKDKLMPDSSCCFEGAVYVEEIPQTSFKQTLEVREWSNHHRKNGLIRVVVPAEFMSKEVDILIIPKN